MREIEVGGKKLRIRPLTLKLRAEQLPIRHEINSLDEEDTLALLEMDAARQEFTDGEGGPERARAVAAKIREVQDTRAEILERVIDAKLRLLVSMVHNGDEAQPPIDWYRDNYDTSRLDDDLREVGLSRPPTTALE